jgi:hypothetical protein
VGLYVNLVFLSMLESIFQNDYLLLWCYEKHDSGVKWVVVVRVKPLLLPVPA